jgi:hypothetical protein
MINRLLANLPFNPSMSGQISFYAARLRQEASVRRLGAIFIACAMALQFFAVAAPPKPTLARSANDIITGGFSSKSEAVSLCKDNAQNYRDILGSSTYNISCQDVAGASVQTIKSTDFGGQIYAIGRIPYGKAGEYSLAIPNVGTFYARPLAAWDTHGPSLKKRRL